MSKFRFFPEDYELDEKLTEWTKKKGLSDSQIEDQLERIKIHEFQPMRSCPRRTWQRWIMNAIDWGRVVPTVTREYRQPDATPEPERDRKYQENIDRLKNMKMPLKVVK